MAALPPPAPDLRADLARARAARERAMVYLCAAPDRLRLLAADGQGSISWHLSIDHVPALVEVLERGLTVTAAERQADEAMRAARVAVAEADLALARARAELRSIALRFLGAGLAVCLCIIWAGAL